MTTDDRIAKQCLAARAYAERLGFANPGTRGDNQIHLEGDAPGREAKLWSNQIHGEGRVSILVEEKRTAFSQNIELRFTGRPGHVAAETRTAREKLDIVKRWVDDSRIAIL